MSAFDRTLKWQFVSQGHGVVVQFDTKCAVLIPVGSHLSDGANGAPPGLLAGFWGWDEKGRRGGKWDGKGRKGEDRKGEWEKGNKGKEKGKRG